MIKYLKALRMNHIKSQIEERRTEKIKSLHKLYWKTYIEILIESLVHDRNIKNKHKQLNRVHPIRKKKRKEEIMGSLDPSRHRTILYLLLSVSNSL